MREQLRHATAALHDHVERSVDLGRAAATLAGYRALLERLLGYHRPLERALRGAPGASELPFALPNRTALLERDLAGLGIAPGAVPDCRELPPLRTREQLAGCLYVIEGAALGGRVIAKTVRERLGDAPLRFFEGAEPIGSRWRAVVGWLDGLPGEGVSTAETVAASIATFESLRDWMTAA